MNTNSGIKLIFENFDNKYIDYIYDIEKSSIDEYWSKEQLQGLIGKENVIARAGIMDGEVVCSYSLYVVADEGYINNLSVKEQLRGKGIGSQMMQDMISCASAREVRALTLEVNENNAAAINLYKKFGFTIEGARPKFYRGKDTALIMWKTIV